MKKPIRIAVVDDHAMVREGFISRLKENEELEVVLDAGNGIELLEKLKKRTVDVVLLDLEMPEMDGFETTEKLNILI
jgi:DNA-binding NarL/FixJ family response regulator